MSTDEDILDTLSACFLHKGTGRDKALDSTFAHRIQLCRAWGVHDEAAWRVLDVGCGQAESTAVLAYFVGDHGHATGLDPAAPSYGAPFTLEQSQDYLKKSALGPRITFVRSDLADFLHGRSDSGAVAFDAAVFCHSLWYLADRDVVRAQFAALAKARIPRVLLAEYSTGSSDDDDDAEAAAAAAKRPHQLAARAQMRLHALREQYPDPERSPSTLNIRGALEVEELLAVAEDAGWSVARRGVVSPPEEMRDGYWEARIVTAPSFKEEVVSLGLPKEQEESVLRYIPQVEQAMAHLEAVDKPVATMDVVWAVLELQ